ncbi:DUF305 domain-containing protein [Pseudooceanicola sp.]
MPYVRFALMIATSTLVMFVLMYLNTFALEHVFYSETRVYMAILMGATMAVVMMLWMWGMYPNKGINVAILVGAALVFAGSLWLVRSQATVSGPSYMRAMIPHHSIAIMTSERATIRDARVNRLAEEIANAQRKEIAEMRYLVSEVAAGRVVDEVYQDPQPQPGTMTEAMTTTLRSALDPQSMPEREAALAIDTAGGCRFKRAGSSDPILWTASDGLAAVKINGVIVPMQPGEGNDDLSSEWNAEGLSVAVTLDADATRANAALRFAMEEGPSSGYLGHWSCDG